jgi:hypothetical protein
MAVEGNETSTESQVETGSNPDASLDAIMAEARTAAEAEAVAEDTGETETATDESRESQNPESQESETLQDGSDSEAEDETQTFSRRDAKRYFDQLLKERQKTAELEKQVESKDQTEDSLAKEVLTVLGSKEAYEQAERDALDTSKPLAVRNAASETLVRYKANRTFFAKLQTAAHKSAMAMVAGEFAIAGNLEGVDKSILLGDKLSKAFQHVYEVGGKKVAAEKDARIKELETELKTARAAAQGAAGSKFLSGGKSGDGTLDVSDWFDKNGVLRDDIEQAALTGALRG